jgi:hypothetical protein
MHWLQGGLVWTDMLRVTEGLKNGYAKDVFLYKGHHFVIAGG